MNTSTFEYRPWGFLEIENPNGTFSYKKFGGRSPYPMYSDEKFASLLDNTIAEIKKLSELKGGEYAGDGDRLANFRRNALAFGLTKEQVWGVYAGKHWDAIAQYINDGGHGIKRDRLESISGRADDLIVYLLLFKAMVEENGE